MKVFGIVGWKNSGKTGLVERLVIEFLRRDVRISTVKHAHHEFDVDQEGRDSFRHRVAGAQQVMLTSSKRWALMSELRDQLEPNLTDLLKKMDPVDLVLVEGFKGETHMKLECHRDINSEKLRAETDDNIVLIASDTELMQCSQKVISLDDTVAIVDFIMLKVGLK